MIIQFGNHTPTNNGALSYMYVAIIMLWCYCIGTCALETALSCTHTYIAI